jgi:A/G-specific adenine glycosylase
MLQQTQVKTVIPYFTRFIARFPDIWALAEANEDSVLAYWSGLGYYSRAHNLCKTAKIICEKYKGEFPVELAELIALPGIGPSTAGAISAQAFNQSTPILDGNVKRVLCRYFLVDGWPEQAKVKQQLWRLAKQCMPTTRCADYTQAIMDLGATCCTTKNPSCQHCPLQTTCLANLHDKAKFYPHKKIQKTLPVKQQQFLLLYREDERIYLEKRPPTGIWGGLWCMPSIGIADCPTEYLSRTYALINLKTEELLNIKHSFSHFHLEIKALAIQAMSKENTIAEYPGKWFKISEISELGLAKPIKDIISRFINFIDNYFHL